MNAYGASCRVGSVVLALLGASSSAMAQARAPGALERMRGDLTAQRYAAVIEQGNRLLESRDGPSTEERMQLWQLLAAAYYPRDPAAQYPDSAALPLEAMVRLVPDVTLDATHSWPGLDSLLERARAAQFVVVTRPRREYAIAPNAPAFLTVVASRPARFRLTSIALATGVAVTHSVVDADRAASLPILSMAPSGEIFAPGAYRLEVWAFDRASGDSVIVSHRAVATLVPIVTSSPVVTPTTAPPAAIATRGRTAPLGAGIVIAGATAGLAMVANRQGVFGADVRVDGRAFIVVAAMLGATVVSVWRRPPPPPKAVAPPPRVQRTSLVTLRLDPPVH